MNNFVDKVKSILTNLALSLLSITIALIFGVFFILLTEQSPITAYSALYEGAFGDFRAILNTLWRSTPLILTGLAVALPFRAGLFNIGAEGQLLMGGFTAGVVGFYFTNLPAFIHLPFAILAGMIVGGIWGGLPGFLKAKMDVHEVISTIMLNNIAIALTINYGINYFRDTGRQATPRILQSAALLRFNDMADHFIFGKIPFIEIFEQPGIRLHINFIFAIITAIILWFLLFKTTLGYEMRAVGHNPDGAEYGGINASKGVILAMFISGAVAGLAGVGEALGTHLSFMAGMDAGHGFTGIAVALIGLTHPIGVIFGGLLFGALAQGGLEMQFAGVPSDIVMIIQALVIFFVASLQVLKVYLAKRKAKGGVE
ncbi:MAG: ABC transporter permease [Halanaerobium sp. MSAO_Bac5]|nr:ABC transporter permease [Halanaerobium polyolivorans]RQD76293.1 MAG: ABC transporter permease [Halanaerobium sp. MSAO_Bac5]